MAVKCSNRTLWSTADEDGYPYWVEFEDSPFTKGNSKFMYKGRLNGKGPRSGEYCAVKVFRTIDIAKHDDWSSYVNRIETANKLAAQFNKMIDNQYTVRFMVPTLALIDISSTCTDCIYFLSNTKRIKSDDCVAIEPYIGSKFRKFYRNSPLKGAEYAYILQAFSHFTASQTGDTLVCGLQGQAHGTEFLLANPIIHSANQVWGPKDQGAHGFRKFFSAHTCNEICQTMDLPEYLETMSVAEEIDQETGKKSLELTELETSPKRFVSTDNIEPEVVQPDGSSLHQTEALISDTSSHSKETPSILQTPPMSRVGRTISAPLSMAISLNRSSSVTGPPEFAEELPSECISRPTDSMILDGIPLDDIATHLSDSTEVLPPPSCEYQGPFIPCQTVSEYLELKKNHAPFSPGSDSIPMIDDEFACAESELMEAVPPPTDDFEPTISPSLNSYLRDKDSLEIIPHGSMDLDLESQQSISVFEDNLPAPDHLGSMNNFQMSPRESITQPVEVVENYTPCDTMSQESLVTTPCGTICQEVESQQSMVSTTKDSEMQDIVPVSEPLIEASTYQIPVRVEIPHDIESQVCLVSIPPDCMDHHLDTVESLEALSPPANEMLTSAEVMTDPKFSLEEPGEQSMETGNGDLAEDQMIMQESSETQHFQETDANNFEAYSADNVEVGVQKSGSVDSISSDFKQSLETIPEGSNESDSAPSLDISEMPVDVQDYQTVVENNNEMLAENDVIVSTDTCFNGQEETISEIQPSSTMEARETNVSEETVTCETATCEEAIVEPAIEEGTNICEETTIENSAEPVCEATVSQETSVETNVEPLGETQEAIVESSVEPVAEDMASQETTIMTGDDADASELTTVETIGATTASEETVVENVGETRESEETPVETLGAVTTSEETIVENVGETRESEETPVETLGAVTSEEINVETVGDATTCQDTPIETVGEATYSQETTSKDTVVETIGEVTTSQDMNVETGGEATTAVESVGEVTSQETNVETGGEVTSQETTVETGGEATTCQETTVETGGEVTTSQETNVETGGEATTSQETTVETGGEVTTSQETNVETGGEVTTSQETNVETGGEATTCQETTVETGGEVTTSQETNVETGGEATTCQETTVETGGEVTTSQETNVETGGEATTSQETNVETGGEATTSQETNVETGGEATTCQETTVESGGDVTTSQETNVETGGEATTSQETNVETGGEATTCQETTVESGGDVTTSQENNVETGGEATTCQETTVETGGEVNTSQETNVENGGEATTCQETNVETGGEATTSEENTVEIVGDVTSQETNVETMAQENTAETVEPVIEDMSSQYNTAEPACESAVQETAVESKIESQEQEAAIENTGVGTMEESYINQEIAGSTVQQDYVGEDTQMGEANVCQESITESNGEANICQQNSDDYAMHQATAVGNMYQSCGFVYTAECNEGNAGQSSMMESTGDGYMSQNNEQGSTTGETSACQEMPDVVGSTVLHENSGFEATVGTIGEGYVCQDSAGETTVEGSKVTESIEGVGFEPAMQCYTNKNIDFESNVEPSADGYTSRDSGFGSVVDSNLTGYLNSDQSFTVNSDSNPGSNTYFQSFPSPASYPTESMSATSNQTTDPYYYGLPPEYRIYEDCGSSQCETSCPLRSSKMTIIPDLDSMEHVETKCLDSVCEECDMQQGIETLPRRTISYYLEPQESHEIITFRINIAPECPTVDQKSHGSIHENDSKTGELSLGSADYCSSCQGCETSKNVGEGSGRDICSYHYSNAGDCTETMPQRSCGYSSEVQQNVSADWSTTHSTWDDSYCLTAKNQQTASGEAVYSKFDPNV